MEIFGSGQTSGIIEFYSLQDLQSIPLLWEDLGKSGSKVASKLACSASFIYLQPLGTIL